MCMTLHLLNRNFIRCFMSQSKAFCNSLQSIYSILTSVKNIISPANLSILCMSPLSGFFRRMLKNSNVRTILSLVISVYYDNWAIISTLCFPPNCWQFILSVRKSFLLFMFFLYSLGCLKYFHCCPPTHGLMDVLILLPCLLGYPAFHRTSKTELGSLWSLPVLSPLARWLMRHNFPPQPPPNTINTTLLFLCTILSTIMFNFCFHSTSVLGPRPHSRDDRNNKWQ